jgi:predicted ATPase/DNA-binding CsgD family transcriptional regulator
VPTESPTLTDAGVSVREAEVLELLGEHLTNAEISGRLFISVRTVESHVSSLLRKLGVADRRALAKFATALGDEGDEVASGPGSPALTAAVTGSGPGAPPSPAPASVLPAPLTPFVGRVAERAGLAAALTGQRLVTAVGPGGVGKTRLSLAVAADLADEYADGVWYVDLVPVTDPSMIPAAVAGALGLGDQSGRSIDDTVLARLADAEALVVLDNCEHVVDRVVVFVERLLAACPRVTVLATSRARLLVPFERVFPVGGLSLGADGAGAPAGSGVDIDDAADAVALFLHRAAAVGVRPAGADDLRRVAAICAQLDGMALAIELAAARLPTLGFDGLEAGLADQLGMLAGRPRLDDRHSSLRATLDWSYALLTPEQQAVLRRVSVFAAPFTADDAARVAGFPPLDDGGVIAALAHLADQSLVVVVPARSGTRYRVLETIRQYGTAALDEAEEHDDVADRHLRWATDHARALGEVLTGHSPTDLPASWRIGFDQVADDLRAALGWAAARPDRRAAAYDLGLTLGDLAFHRGLSGEAQRRYEESGALGDGEAATMALRNAAGVAQIRQMGDDGLRLFQAVARLALRQGDTATAGLACARAALLIERCPGIFGVLPSQADTDAFLTEARRLAIGRPDDARLAAMVLIAEVFDGEERDPLVGVLVERAVDLARRLGDVHLESVALDGLTIVHLGAGDPGQANVTARRRADALLPLPVVADTGFELPDALQMASETCVATGDLVAARRYAEQLRTLPFFGDDAHLALSRLLVVEALAGNWDRVLELSLPFRDRWERAGAPPTSNLAQGTAAVAMVHGLRGDLDAQAAWDDMVVALRASLVRRYGQRSRANPAFEAVVALHRGRPDEASELLAAPPESIRDWHAGRMRQWYAALWAEAAVLTGHPATPDRLERARSQVAGNPIATAIVGRAAVLAGDPDLAVGPARGTLLSLAADLDAADCRYQAARTRVLAGGDARTAGEAVLSALGATPMVLP